MRPRLLAYLLVLALAPVFMWANPAEATSHASPEVFANASQCNRSIVEPNDLLCQIRYELPQSISDGVSDAWCAELNNPNGCASTPANPTEPTSMPTGKARIALWQNCGATCATGSIIAIRDVPRIWHGISAIYVPESAGVTWADSTIRMCVESVPGAFTTDEQACISPAWSTASNTTTAQRDDAGDSLVTNLTNLQSLRLQALNTYVSNGLITEAGTLFAKEMLESAVILFPGVFKVSATLLNQGLPGTGSSQLNADINATAVSYRQAFDDFGEIITPTGGAEIGGLILFGTLGLITFILIYMRTQEFIWPSIGIAAWGLFGVAAGGVDSSVIFVYVVMLAMPALVYAFGRIGFAR